MTWIIDICEHGQIEWTVRTRRVYQPYTQSPPLQVLQVTVSWPLGMGISLLLVNEVIILA